MKHRAVETFWTRYETLPLKIRRLADKNYTLLNIDPTHGSLRFKKVKDEIWSVRVGLHYRALAYPDTDGYTWFWIGTHTEYDRIIG